MQKNRHQKTETKRLRRCREICTVFFSQRREADSRNNSIFLTFSVESEDSEKGCRGQEASPVSDTVKQMRMQTTTTGCCLIRKESGSAMTQEILKQNECRTLIFYARDFLARHSPSLDEGKDLPMQEEPFSSKLPDWLQTKRPAYFLLENVPGLLSHDKGRTFHTILSTLSELGYHVEWKVLNSRISESPSRGSGCILSDILMEDVPEKYYLSQKQMEQLLYKSMLVNREKESMQKKD